MKSDKLYFTAPGTVEIQREELPNLGTEDVLVATLCSAISPGTEMLVYRGHFPENLPADANLPTLGASFSYPIAYGYAAVGRVLDCGANARAWQGRLVFVFHPHASHFVTAQQNLFAIPTDFAPETALFLPNTETAVNLVQDAAPLIGEHALVLGQGIVGLLTTALLARFPLMKLVTTDFYPLRRAASAALGATSLDAGSPMLDETLRTALANTADLTIEVSGSPAALDTAIRQTGFGGRIVIGSWYGSQKASVDLGGSFHRNRVRLISSQVSTISPSLSGRWDKSRRFALVFDALRMTQPQQWITQRIPFDRSELAYRVLDQNPGESIQVVLEYPQ